MFIVTVIFEIDSQHIETFHEAIRAQAKNSLDNETTCRQFDVCFDADNPSRCFLYEKYDDREAFDRHLQSDHFKNFDATVSSWIVSKSVQTWVQQDS